MPQSTRASTLQELHQGHYAVDKMNLWAKEAVYWPGISEDIKATYHKCEICAKFARTQQKETLQYVETLQTTWEQLGMDIFTLKNTYYLLVFDYFSWFPVIQKLQSLHSTTIIKHLKEIFTEIDIPRCIVPDGGTQFTAQEFKNFMHRWEYNIPHQCTVQWPSRAVCSNHQKQPKQSHGGRRGLTFSNPLIYLYIPESQPPITGRTTKFKKILMPTTTLNRTTEPHPAIQKCNTITKARTSKTIQQKCKRLTQFTNRRYSPHTTSTKFEKMGTRKGHWKSKHKVIQGQDHERRNIHQESKIHQNQKHKLWTQLTECNKQYGPWTEHNLHRKAKVNHKKTTETDRNNELYQDMAPTTEDPVDNLEDCHQTICWTI